MVLIHFTILFLASHMMLCDAAVTVFGLRASGLSGKPDPYAKVWCNGVYGGETITIKDTSSPIWDIKFYFGSCKQGQSVKVELWDKNVFFDDRLGSCSTLTSSGSRSISCYLGNGTLYFSYSAN